MIIKYLKFPLVLLITLFWLVLFLSDFSYSQDKEIVIEANWRAGEIMRYEFLESISITDHGELISENIYNTLVLVEVAAKRGNQEYILLWRIQESNAVLFSDETLDKYILDLLADGIVVHMDSMGGFSHTSNMDYLWGQFITVVELLDQTNHWIERQDKRDYIQYYVEHQNAFEDILVRDITYLFGMHGVLTDLRNVFEYDTWQQNPWGEPVASKGILETISFDQDTKLVEFRNTVEGSISKPLKAELFEQQYFIIDTSSGWPVDVLLVDTIYTNGHLRHRKVGVKQIIY